MFENVDGRRTDAGVTGILLAHQWAFGSGELKNIKFIVRQFASTCLSVKTPQTTQITINEHQNQPLQLQTTSCPQTHHACVEIDHEIISTAILILSAEPFKRVVVN